MPRQRVGRTPCVGDSHTRHDPERGKAPDKAKRHRLFAALKMVGARRVDHQSIGVIGCRDRGYQPIRPMCEPIERRVIGRAVMIHDNQLSDERLRFRDRRPRLQSGATGGGVDRHGDPPPSLHGLQGQRRVRRRRGVAQRPA